MTLPQTTQQFTPIILGLDLTIKDQQAAVKKYLEELTLSSHPQPQPHLTKPTTPSQQERGSKLDSRSEFNSASSNLGITPHPINHIVWLNQLDQPFGIEQWRDLQPQIQSIISTPTFVVAILCADTLSLATQNAMLKSLEEPPPNVQFLLTTNRPTSLLPTIQSRCQLVRYSMLVNDQAGGDQFGSQNEVRPSINQANDRQRKNQASKSLTHELPASSNLTQSTITDAFNLIKTIHTGSVATALIASDQFKDRNQAKDWIIQVLDWSQKQLVREKGNTGQITTNQPLPDLGLVLPLWITALLTAYQQLEQNLHVKLVMDQLFLVLVDNQR